MKVLAAFTIAHLNQRKEAAGDEPGKLACDIKLTSVLTDSACASLFGTESSFDRLLGDLWNKDGELTTTDLNTLVLNSQIVGGKATLTPEFSGAEKFEGVMLNKIKLKPEAGRKVEVSMRLQVHPTASQVSKLSEWLETDVTVLVERVQGELNLDNESKGKRAKKAGGEQQNLH